VTPSGRTFAQEKLGAVRNRMESARSSVEKRMIATTARDAKWIQVRGRWLRSRRLSWLCCPAQKIPSVRKLRRSVTRRGVRARSAR